MKIDEMISTLREQPELPLVFELDGARISKGYHITEVKHADIVSLDCGLNQRSWTEFTVQLLDGAAGSSEPWMMNHKASNILNAAIEKLLVAEENPSLFVEYSSRNLELKKLSVQRVQHDTEFSVVTLQHESAVCKPFQSLLVSGANIDEGACCSGGKVDTQCC